MSIEQNTINTLRILSVEAVQEANSGHPGLPLGAAPMAYSLWANTMNHNPKNPNWINRDRFVLSAGHGSALLYSLLYLFDYGLTIEDLKDFRQLDSLTPGHPEYGHTKGVEVTTGPLGQGMANSVGMAIAEAHMAAKFNREGHEIIDHYTYVIAGDGDMMEGITYEATSLAGNLGLGKLIVLYDSNSITIEGSTDLAFDEDVCKRYEALGWETFKVEDGNDIEKIQEKIDLAKENLSQPTMIKITTEIGYGSPEHQGSSSAHGSPLGREDVEGTKKFFEYNEEKFTVSKDVKEHMDNLIKSGEDKERVWNEKYKEYKREFPELAEELENWMEGKLPIDYLESDEFWEFNKDNSTRGASGEIINKLKDRIPNLIGGSADLAPSNKTYMTDKDDFSKENYNGKNLRFGIREHGMAGILNGMCAHGGLRVFGGTFFVFSDYMKPSMRLSALMGLPVTYVLTHDSIGVGEDGPTHQPIEHLAMFRALPNFTTFRPADPRETAAGWYAALDSKTSPTGLILSRQKLPLLDGTGKDALKGGYILRKESKDLQLILMSSGSEVHLIYEAAKELEEKGIGTRVVSMPSWELYESQSDEYKNEVLPQNIIKRIAVEAGVALGWHKYTGLNGKVIGMESFGASGPGDEVFKKFGFTVENIIKEALKLI